MSHIHDHETTVIERDPTSSALIIVVSVVVGIVLIWAIFFSGWVIDRGPDNVTNIDRTTEGDTNVDVNNPQPTTASSSPPPTQPAPTTAP